MTDSDASGDTEQCPVCDGIGRHFEGGTYYKCTDCGGTGEIDV